MLFDLNAQIFELREQLLVFTQEDYAARSRLLLERLRQKQWMVVGEGAVFLTLLGVGFWQIRKSFRKEAQLARQQKNFLLSVTHELKSPVAAVKLFLQTILKRDLEKERQLQVIQKSLQEANRLDQLVEKILLAAQIENHTFLLSPAHINLKSLLDELCSSARALFPEAQIQLSFKGQEMVYADPQALTSIVSNLIENAVKYSADAPRIHVQVNNQGDWLSLVVSDEGKGIDETEKKQIFTRFFRSGDEETRKTKGTGLGLFIVHFLVQAHQGSISVRDNRPKGSIFDLRLNFSNDN